MTQKPCSNSRDAKRSEAIIAREAQRLRRQYRIRTLTIVATETKTQFMHRFDDGETIRLDWP